MHISWQIIHRVYSTKCIESRHSHHRHILASQHHSNKPRHSFTFSREIFEWHNFARKQQYLLQHNYLCANVFICSLGCMSNSDNVFERHYFDFANKQNQTEHKTVTHVYTIKMVLQSYCTDTHSIQLLQHQYS